MTPLAHALPALVTPGESLVEMRRSHLQAPRFRVLFVTSMWPDRKRPHYGPFVASQARSLEARGVAVDVIAIRGYASQRAYVAAYPAIARYVSGVAPAVVHVHTGHAATVGLVGLRAPRVISFVGGDLLGHPGRNGITLKSRLEARTFRHLARLADATITKSTEMELVLPMRLRKRNTVIPNGVDLSEFSGGDRATAREELGWSPHELVALFMGDPSDPRKNVELARAGLQALPRNDKVRLHVGWGTKPGEVPRLMTAADVLVLPSLSEGSPNVVKEAMACELPVVATPVGDVRERLVGVAGCFVTDFTPQGFGRAVGEALRHKNAPAAREAVRHLSVDRVAARIERVYDTVIANHRRPWRPGVSPR